ncbi:MAG: subtilisin family serine protease [Rhodothermales bacterium]|jgi:subtilisin family serine protease
MTFSSLLPRIGLVAFAFCVISLSGCTDSITGPDVNDAVETELTETASKFRHANLFDRALRTGTNQVAGKKPNELGLIIKISPYALMERYKLMERYALMERYKLMERYEYTEAFSGFAVTIEDTTGGSDFTDIISALSAEPGIEWFEPDYTVVNPTAAEIGGQVGQSVPWNVAYVGGKESSTVSGDGSGSVPVDVYIIDTGVSNDDLNIVESVDFRGVVGMDANDYDGHGTHVAGIIGAMDNTEGLVGVAPGARIHNLKVMGDDGTSDVSVVIAAVEHVIAARRANPTTPMVVNMSLGENIGTTQFTALDESVDLLVSLGVTVVVAAGNQGVNADLVTPAHVPNVITVGAHDSDGYFTSFSNSGGSVDILAPGANVISLQATQGGVGTPVQMTGTSMAAPHVAGAAALYLYANPTASPADVRAALLAAARGGILLTGAQTVAKSVYVGGM